MYYGQLGQIAYDPDEDKIQCHLCGQWLHCVGGPHLTRKHQWTAAQYRDAFHLPRGTPTVAHGASDQRRAVTTAAIADGRIVPQLGPLAVGWNTPGTPQPPPAWRSLAALHPELARELHPTRNGDLDPRALAPTSSQRVWWRCPACGHEWQTRARSPRARARDARAVEPASAPSGCAIARAPQPSPKPARTSPRNCTPPATTTGPHGAGDVLTPHAVVALSELRA